MMGTAPLVRLALQGHIAMLVRGRASGDSCSSKAVIRVCVRVVIIVLFNLHIKFTRQAQARPACIINCLYFLANEKSKISDG